MEEHEKHCRSQQQRSGNVSNPSPARARHAPAASSSSPVPVPFPAPAPAPAGPPVPPPRRPQAAPPGKLFKKCKSATFQIDGATYTIEQGSLTVVRRTAGKQQPSPQQQQSNAETTTAMAAVAAEPPRVRQDVHQQQQQQQHGGKQTRRRPGCNETALDDDGDDDGDARNEPPEGEEGEELPAVETVDACDVASTRLRRLLRQLRCGDVLPLETLRRDLSYAARVLEVALIAEDGATTTRYVRSPRKTRRPDDTAAVPSSSSSSKRPPPDGPASARPPRDSSVHRVPPSSGSPTHHQQQQLEEKRHQPRQQHVATDGNRRASPSTCPSPPPPPQPPPRNSVSPLQQQPQQLAASPPAAGTTAAEGAAAAPATSGPGAVTQKRRPKTPAWARRLADEDDELSEVQPDAVPAEVREWLASTFTRQLAAGRRRTEDKPKFRSVAHAIRAGIFVDRMYRRVGHAALLQFPTEVGAALRNIDEWSFDVFGLHDASAGQPVKYLGYELLNRYGVLHKFRVPPAALEAFLARVEDGYQRHSNPYHNNVHAADVAQTVHYMLARTGLAHWMSELEVFATLVAALVHDFEHTGTTNSFHVMSRSDTALLYNDRAVLENHHVSAAFRLMRDDDCNVLQNLSPAEYREFRGLVIEMVLATDMSFHFQQLKNVRAALAMPDAPASIDKSRALSLVLHSCDISHPAKEWRTHTRWTKLLLDEFFRQGDMEKALGLPFSPLCDRNNTLVAESQIGFIDFIVEPSMTLCGELLDIVLSPGSGGGGGGGTGVPTPPPPAASRSKSAGASASEQPPAAAAVAKPWMACLAENKRIWKEQAARDAEQRAAQIDDNQQRAEGEASERVTSGE